MIETINLDALFALPPEEKLQLVNDLWDDMEAHPRGTPMPATATSVFALDWDEKLELAQDLWDDIVESGQELPIPAWHLEELDRQIAEQEANPQPGKSWEEVIAGIRARHGR